MKVVAADVSAFNLNSWKKSERTDVRCHGVREGGERLLTSSPTIKGKLILGPHRFFAFIALLTIGDFSARFRGIKWAKH